MNTGNPMDRISERAQGVLKALVERYIREGHPVGSKSLAESSAFALSPATIRNVMADLESFGLVTSPHTSAGRIPTEQGYRFFVDCLITMQPPPERDLMRLQEELNPDESATRLVSAVSDMLSRLTSLASVVTVPNPERSSLRQVEFLPLSESRVLVILVLNEKEVENRILHTQRQYGETELRQAANYINAHFSGVSLSDIRHGLLSEMRKDKDQLNQFMQALLDLAGGAFQQKGSGIDYVVAGQSNLINSGPPEKTERLRELFDAFQQKQEMLYLLDECMDSEGVQLFIGEESGYEVLDSLSLVTAPYAVEGRHVGVLGVIGPTRMHYERVIPLVDATSRLLSAVLNH